MGIDGSSIASKKDNTAAPTQHIKTKGGLINCRTCSKSVSQNAASCPHCGEPLKKEAVQHAGKTGELGIDKILAIVGSALMAIGVFCPIVTLPIMGSMNYFGNGDRDGVFILGLAAASILCMIIKKMQYLWITGLSSLGILGYSFYQFKSRINAITSDMNRDLSGNPFRGIADAAMSSVSMEWGWAIMVAGAIMVIAAAGMSKK